MITKIEAEKAYADLIQLRRSEVLVKDKTNPGQIEFHHVLPRCCGGSNDQTNIVALYAKEHFMAHVYLWAIHHDDEFHYKMVYALNQMIKGTVNGSRTELRDFILQSEEYQKAREEFAQYTSQTISGKILGKKNGTYGKSNEDKSFLYDPLYTFKTTIAGQLFICMWAERWVEVCPDLKFIQKLLIIRIGNIYDTLVQIQAYFQSHRCIKNHER